MTKIIMSTAVTAVAVTAVAVMSLSAGIVAVPPLVPVIPIPVVNTPFYIGAGIGLREIEEFGYYVVGDKGGAGGKGDYDNYITTLIAGYEINDYLGVEGRYTFSIGGYDFRTTSIYGVARYENKTDFVPYAGIGYSWVSYDDEFNIAGSDDANGVSWIIGSDYKINNKWSVFADLTYYIEPHDHTALIGIKYNF